MINDPAELDPAGPEPIELAPALLERMAAVRAAALRTLDSDEPVYGVNTGMGNLSKVRLTEADQRAHQRNLLLGRAVGGPPWLPPDESRAVLIARLKTFLTGDAAVSVDLIHQLVALINSPYTPAIPAEGAGSAGEIIPLAHAAGPLVGIGWLQAAPNCKRLKASCLRSSLVPRKASLCLPGRLVRPDGRRLLHGRRVGWLII